LARIAGGFGWSLDDDSIVVMDPSPVDVLIDQVVYELLEEVEKRDVRRVVIDSVNDLVVASADSLRFREFLYSLVQRFARAGRSLLLVLESSELFGVNRPINLAISPMSDNVILLQRVLDEATTRRALTVLKTRGSSHTNHVHEFQITNDGIRLGAPLTITNIPGY